MQQNNIDLIKNKIREVLKLMGFEAEVAERIEEGRYVFNIRTSDAQLLIGKQGANLGALQFIIKLLMRRELAEERLVFGLDIDDYYDKRAIYLKEIARRAAHQARSSRRNVALPSMPPHERRIIHNYLSLFSDISSESMGQEPNRRVVIRIDAKKEKEDIFNFIENM